MRTQVYLLVAISIAAWYEAVKRDMSLWTGHLPYLGIPRLFGMLLIFLMMGIVLVLERDTVDGGWLIYSD